MKKLRREGRDPGGVTLVGVGKRQPPELVAQAIEAGLTDLGESYLQEARRKFPLLPAVRKHFIGHIQSNKAKAIAATFDVVQSVDRAEAGVALGRAAQELGATLPVLLQLNITPSDRFGCRPDRGRPSLPKRFEARRACASRASWQWDRWAPTVTQYRAHSSSLPRPWHA